MGKITFDHAAIYGGVLYPANTPIEVKETPKNKALQGDTEAPKKVTKKAGAKDNDDSATV